MLDGNFLPGSLPHKFILIVILIICFAVNKSEFSVCVFFISIRLYFFCHCSVCLSVCLVLWASLPENKIDDDDDGDNFFSLSVCRCAPVSLRL